MRQGFLVLAFVAYSLLAVAQTLPYGGGPFGNGMPGLNQHQLNTIELDKIMVDLSEGGLQEIFLPVLSILKERYKARYDGKELPKHLEEFYPIYQASHLPLSPELMQKYAELGWPAPTAGGPVGMSPGIGMPGMGIGGMISELANIGCGTEKTASCLRFFGSTQMTLEALKAYWEAQNICLLQKADEIQNIRENITGTDVSNPECANLIRTDVRNFRKALEEGKYGIAEPNVVRFGTSGSRGGN